MSKNDYQLKYCLILVLFLLCSCRNNTEIKSVESNNAFNQSTEQIAVEHSKINFGEFYLELKSYGKAYAKQKVDLRFTLNEKISFINVINGQKVKKGQLIAKQESQIYLNKVVNAKEQLERSKIDVEDILIGFNYSFKDSTSIPKATLDMAKNRSNYNSSLSNLSDAKIELSSTILSAPINGVIANLKTKKYSYPDNTEPFCTVIDNSTFDVEFEILESDFVFLEKNQKIEVVNDFTETIIEGRITEINPTINNDGMISVKGTFKDENSTIIDGMNVSISIKKILKDKLFVPKESVVLRDNKKVVFTYKEGKAVWNYVKTSFENSKFIVVEEGLKETDIVIHSGNINLAHNSSVTVEN